MYKTKKEVDGHVRHAFSKVRSESERNMRSFTIAKLYFKINEFTTAEQYLNAYLSVKEDNEQAHKLLGQCYQRLKNPDKALLAFQRSLQLNVKQPDVLVEVCQLLLNDDKISSNKAKYWCELAESEKVQHDAVFSLRLKVMNNENLKTNLVEALIQQEISNRPNDVQLRVRLVRYYIEQNQIMEAFKCVHQLEMQQKEELTTSSEWYNVVWLMLSKYEQWPNTKKDWDFWLLVIICLERQVQLSLTCNISTGTSSYANVRGGGTIETANFLFNLDQYLFKVNKISETFNVQKEFMDIFMEHFRGQFLLHAVALIFKRELLQNKNKWKETVQTVLPLLLLAVQITPSRNEEPWIKHVDEQSKQLLSLWQREASFRCAQVGRTLLSCITDESDVEEKETTLNKFFDSHIGIQSCYLWKNIDDLLAQIRQTCSDNQWRRNIFALLFCNSDQKIKEQSSLLINSPKLSEPRYEVPSFSDLEQYEEAAQYLRPQSLHHIVYLCLSQVNLAYVRLRYFSGLPFSTQNLSFCGAESLNQLDVDTFLYAATIQSQRVFALERQVFESYQTGNVSAVSKPRILPFANVQDLLCNEEQAQWWRAVYAVYKNLSNGNDLAELRATIQYGIETVRGINGPKMDIAIVFKLGKVFVSRAQDSIKPVEKSFLEGRAETIYKYGLNMLKLHNKGVLEPFRKYFKYAKAQTSVVEGQLFNDAEEAVSYLASRYFKRSEYEDFIEELVDVQLPFSTYLQAEAYRKLDEVRKTPKKAKRFFMDKAGECLQQSLALLKSSAHVGPNHPLNSVIPSEIKRLQQTSARFLNESSPLSSNFSPYNNSSTYEDAEGDFYPDNSVRSRREATTAAATHHQHEMEHLVKQMANTLTLLKEEIVETIKPEIQALTKEITTIKAKMSNLENRDTLKPELQLVTKEITSIKDKISGLEDVMRRVRSSSNPPSRDDASNVLDDLYIFEDALQQQLYQTAQNTHNANASNLANAQYGGSPSFLNQQGRLSTAANALHMAAAYNNPTMHPPNATNFPLNFYGQNSAFLLQPPPPPALIQGVNQQHGPPQSVNQRSAPISMSYLDPTSSGSFNFNVNTQTMSLLPAGAAAAAVAVETSRCNNLYNLLQLQAPTNAINVGVVSTTQTAPIPPPPIQVATTTKVNLPLTNQSVERDIPVNVVITSSDPIPSLHNTALQSQTQQPTLSVNIPSHHIKYSAVSLNSNKESPVASIVTPSVVSTTTSQNSTTTTFSFRPQIEAAAVGRSLNNSLNKTNESVASDFNKSEHEETEYDPRPDFEPIIPLPDEIEVRTGEENEEVMFCHRAKLFRLVDKEWKERGLGNIKILKSENGSARILMRRDQTLKICANHKITPEINLTTRPNETKGFIWAANDYADEELRLEMFFVRFKLPETAAQFQQTFKIAQKQLTKPEKVTTQMTTAAQTPSNLVRTPTINFATSTPASRGTDVGSCVTVSPTTPTAATSANVSSKAVFGPSAGRDVGLIFSSKCAPENATQVSSSSSEVTITPFSHFTFGQKTAMSTVAGTSVFPISASASAPSPFATIFSNLSKPSSSPLNMANITSPSTGIETLAQSPSTTNPLTLDTLDKNSVGGLNRSSASETEDDYVPTAHFKPVIPLPDLIEVNTGEENEIVLFEHRAKLLRFDGQAGEWKERGLGNMKLLQDKNDVNKVRLVMRREQIHKLCCNQRLYKDTVFNYATNSKTAISWAGQDFSENELITEILTVRFKTADLCKQFHTSILEAQERMKKNNEVTNSSTKSEQDEEKGGGNKTSKIGFGDAFKPKPGSWTCTACYVPNPSDTIYCAACNAPKDNTVPKKTTSISNTMSTTSTKNNYSFGFTPSSTVGATLTATALESKTKPTFMFGSAIPNTTTVANGFSVPSDTTSSSTQPIATGFGDAFKPKSGSWTCESCYLTNDAEIMHCKACDTPKDNTVPKQDNNHSEVLTLKDVSQKFQFGFNFQDKTATTTGSSNSFIFTPPSSTSTTTNLGYGWKASTGVVNNVATTTAAVLSKPTFTFMLPPNVKDANVATTVHSTNSSTSALGGGESVPSVFSLDKKEFNFVLKPKSPGKVSAKSPPKLGGGGGDADGGDEDADGTYDEEEENNTYFTPVIPLPDKIDVKTGEEDEELLYMHRAKLYRFTDGDWKERGLGNVKILRHKVTKKLRVVMRREQVLKICLNHALNDKVNYKRKDDKSWLFVVNDFSEGQVELQKFSLRFKTKDIAENFMTTVNKALDGSANVIEEVSGNTSLSTSMGPPPSLILDLTEEEKAKADKLKLPYEFFTSQSTCTGCRGCDSDNFQFQDGHNEIFVNQGDAKNPLLPMNLPKLTLNKPLNSSLLKQSALSPVLAAKLENNKSSTMIGEAVSSANTPLTALKSTASFTATTMSAAFLATRDTSTTATPTKAIQTYKPTNSTFSFASALNNTPTESEQSTSGFLLSGLKSFSGEYICTPTDGSTSIFGGGIGGDKQPFFGQASSIFSTEANNSVKVTNDSSPLTTSSIFGGNSGGNASAGFIFGQKPSIFGNVTTPFFGSSTLLFGSSTTNNSTVLSTKPASSDSLFSNVTKGADISSTTNSSTLTTSSIETPAFVDLSKTATASIDFASLAAKSPIIMASTSKVKSDAGGFIGLTNQDAFASFNKCLEKESASNTTSNDSKKNQSAGNVADENDYDPHYEPIIELPDEIVVTTGEEEEKKLFGERAMLYRWDTVNKEWKERGVGELKILLHPVKNTYRLVMRREQIFKLVLNHAIGTDFKFNKMNNNPKSFVWGTMNYAESNEGVLERLAIRFKKVETAEQFSETLMKCIADSSNRVSSAD